jgi:hypothetical protein
MIELLCLVLLHHLLSILVLVLEDILKFIEDTVKKEQYIHSQYLLDSFISNIDYLKVAFNLIKVEENEEQLEFF